LKHYYLLVKNMSKKVMMVGPHIESRGGISSVINGYIESGLFEELGINYFSTYKDGTKSIKIKFYLLSLLKIILALYKSKILHVHTASKWSFRRLSIVLSAGIFLRKKIIVHLHGGGFEKYYKNSSKFEKFLIYKIFNNADKIIVLSNNLVPKIAKLFDTKRIIVLPNTISIPQRSFFKSKYVNEEFVNLIYLGALLERKGIYDLLMAVKHLSDKYDKFKLIICGEGEFEKVNFTIDTLGIEKFVETLGWVCGKAKENVLKKGYILILPSYVEAFPMSLLEGMANGIPVIATSVGGVEDIVDDKINGFIIQPGNIKNLVKKIELLMNDKKLQKKMSYASYKKVHSHFSINKTTERFRNLYQTLC
jgi:glycosyltransferase involved in cell wall biosynthesis